MSSKYVVVLTTTPSRDISLKIAKEVVKNKLAACVNIVPSIYSLYLWKGKIEESSEELLVIKTKSEFINKLYNLIKSLHPYEVPEFIYLSIEGGSNGYLRWIDEELRV